MPYLRLRQLVADTRELQRIEDNPKNRQVEGAPLLQKELAHQQRNPRTKPPPGCEAHRNHEREQALREGLNCETIQARRAPHGYLSGYQKAARHRNLAWLGGSGA